MENQKKYITFALSMVRYIYTHGHRAIDVFVDYGVYRASLKIEANRAAAYSQLIYMSARHPEQVPSTLFDVVEDECFDGDEPCECLGGCFTAEGIVTEVVEEFMENAQAEEPEIMEWYRVYLAQDVVGVTLGSIPHTLEVGRELSKKYGSGQVPVSVATASLFKIRDEIKTEYEKVRACMYLAIRSLSGNGVAVTTSTAIKWRMFGAKNEKELKEILRDKKLKMIFEKWTTKRQYHNILNDLISSNLVQEMPYNRRTCVSASIIEETEFVEAVANKIRNINAKRRNATAKQQRDRLAAMLQDKINSS